MFSFYQIFLDLKILLLLTITNNKMTINPFGIRIAGNEALLGKNKRKAIPAPSSTCPKKLLLLNKLIDNLKKNIRLAKITISGIPP